MPELPEVETIKRDLAANIIGKKIVGVDFLWPGILKGMEPNDFKKIVVGKKILNVERRAKNVYFELEGGVYLLFHMKMTGHLIYTDDCWRVDSTGRWVHVGGKESPMYDPLNQYIRMIFDLSGKKILAFSDLRKFAYLKLLDRSQLVLALKEYGPEPFSKEFDAPYLAKKFSKKSTAIKKVLMDQSIIAGIGNIYADEILWCSRIHPLFPASRLSKKQTEAIMGSIKEILKKAIEMRGTSTSDFRDTKGQKGSFGKVLAVYRRTDLPCPRDGAPIKRIVVGGRGTHFCPVCQKGPDD